MEKERLFAGVLSGKGSRVLRGLVWPTAAAATTT